MPRSHPYLPPIAPPRIPFDFSSLPSANSARSYQQSPAASFYPTSDPNEIYSSGDDIARNVQFQDAQGASARHLPPYPQQGFANQYPQRMPVFPSPFDFPSIGILNPISGGPASFTQMQQPQAKKRPKYTRSKAGCLTCRTKKIKCDEVKPVCSRCEHSQRECTWPAEQPKKKPSRRVRHSASPEETASRPVGSSSFASSSSDISRPPRSGSVHSRSSASEDTGSTLSGISTDDTWHSISGSESGDDRGFDSSAFFPSNIGFGGQLPDSVYSFRAPTQPQSVDMSTLASGLPGLSVSSSSSSPSPVMAGAGLYSSQSGGLPYVMPRNDQAVNFDANGLRYTSGADGRVQWPMGQDPPLGVSDPNAQYTSGGFAADGDYDDSDRNSLPPSSTPNLSVPSPNSMSPVSAPSPQDLSAYTTPSTATMASGQWSNTHLVTQGMPDPIEPFFKTLRERNLIRHYASYSTDLIVAIRTHAVLNPILATALPITISIPPRTNAPVEALRLSLLGVAAVHQSYLYSRSDPDRSFRNMGALDVSPTGRAFGNSASAQQSAESLRLGILLRQNANQCLAYAVQTFDGSWSNAALAASISIAVIDILAGGQSFQSNLMLAKTLIEIRGGPEMILSQNPPQRTTFGSGILVSTPRLLLETLAVYDAFGSLTTGEEPTFLGHGQPSWWFTNDDWSYHQYSVEKLFAMSRESLFLIAKVSSILARLDALGDVPFTEDTPDIQTTLPAAVSLHAEAKEVLAELETAGQSEFANASRFYEVGAEDERIAEETGEAPTGFREVAARRIEHGSQSHMMAFQIVLLRKVFNVPRDDPRIQKLAEDVLQRCLDSASGSGNSILPMPVLLTWPVIIAGCEVSGNWRDTVPRLFDDFRKNCCFDIDTAEQIVNEVWDRADNGLPGDDWKSVLKDRDTNVLIC